MSIPRYLAGIVDDAAIFPPGNAPLAQAEAEHRTHRASEYADLVGGFVVSDGRLPELCELVTEPLEINLVVTGGAGAIERRRAWATRAERVQLRALEFALRDEEDLAHNAQRLVAAVDAGRGRVPGLRRAAEGGGRADRGWFAALDELAARELRLKLRRGGATPDMVPTSAELADLDRGRARPRAAVQVHRRAAPRGPPRRGSAPRVPQRAGRHPGQPRRRRHRGRVLEERDGAVLTSLVDADTLTRTRTLVHLVRLAAASSSRTTTSSSWE